MSKADELKKAFEGLDEGAKQQMGKLHELINRTSMTPEQVERMIENSTKSPDSLHPEMEAIDEMTSKEYAELYGQMAEEIKTDPAKFKDHVRVSGMSEEELATLFQQIKGAVIRYPEVWESKEAAAMLHPRNLAILVNVFKKDKEEE